MKNFTKTRAEGSEMLYLMLGSGTCLDPTSRIAVRVCTGPSGDDLSLLCVCGSVESTSDLADIISIPLNPKPLKLSNKIRLPA